MSTSTGRWAQRPSRTLSTLLGVLIAGSLLVAAGCSNRADDSADTTAAPDPAPTTAAAPATTAAPGDTSGATTPSGSEDTTTPATDVPAATEPPTTVPAITFGDMASPCGPGDATIADGQNGGDTLVLATATDRGAAAAPGLTQEMYDAAKAFAGWCNDQGGIAGLTIEIQDADGKLFEVPAVMEKVCDQAFAMVGGGWAFDDQEFPLFHECDMIDIAGYTVSTTKAMSDGMAQPIPNPSNEKNVGWFQWAAETYPEAVTTFATMYPDFLSTQTVEAQYIEAVGNIPGYEVVDRIAYSPAGEANWAPFAQRLKDEDVQVLAFVGSPEQLSPFLRSAEEVGFEPELIMTEANMYSDIILGQGTAENVVTRMSIIPFEEKDRSEAVADYLAMMDTYNKDGKRAMLGMQSMSAFLLFAQGANACLADNDNVLERQCVLEHVKAISDWTGGGIQAPSNPGENAITECTMLMQVQDDAFTRLYPEIGSADDTGNGFSCDPSQVMQLTGDYGDVTAGKDPNG